MALDLRWLGNLVRPADSLGWFSMGPCWAKLAEGGTVIKNQDSQATFGPLFDLRDEGSTVNCHTPSMEGGVQIPPPAPIVRRITRAEAHHLCRIYHYLRGAPTGVTFAYGAIKDGSLIAVVCFQSPANKDCHKWLQVENSEALELIRLARIPTCQMLMSEFLSHTLRLLVKDNPQVLVVVSYADPAAGHLGTVYQASGWLPMGKSKPRKKILIDGKIKHELTVWENNPEAYKTAERVSVPAKFRFVKVLATGKRGFELRRLYARMSEG